MLTSGSGGQDLIISRGATPDTIAVRNWLAAQLEITLFRREAPPPVNHTYMGDFQKAVVGSYYSLTD